jgi:uncharacterized phosphosugar-binding protein
MPMKAAQEYFDAVSRLLQDLREAEISAIDQAAEICASSIAEGGLVFLFGSGHSRMMAEEMIPRQGCFVGFFALVEAAVSTHASVVGANGLRAPLFLERYEGYAEEILKGFRFGPHDSFIVISTSGIRPVVVEMAMGARQRGMPVIGILSRQHSQSVPAAHSSGKKLIDVCDVVIDNHCPIGDCVLELEGLEWRTGPASTIAGALIINMIRCGTAERLLSRDFKPEILPSHQLPGSQSAVDQLDRFYEAYRKSLRHLYE